MRAAASNFAPPASSTDPGGSGPGLTAGTRGDAAGLPLPAGCLAGVAVAADVEDVDGLPSAGGDGAEAVARSIVSESLLESTGTEPLLEDAEEIRWREHGILTQEAGKIVTQVLNRQFCSEVIFA